MRGNFLSEILGLLPSWRRIGGVPMKQFHLLENFTQFAVRCFSSSKQNSFTVSYLINSCGLSPETAISASKKVQFENPENPDSVLALLKNHGCTNIHISKIVAKYPRMLLANPEKTLFLKLQFLGSAGLSREELAKLILSNPGILYRSLEKTLIPTYNVLKRLLIGEENAMKALTNQFWISCGNAEKTIAPNAKLLKEIGVPMEHISFLLTNYPTLSKKSEDFSIIVKKVLAMGFDPQRLVFVNALQVLCQMSGSTWEQKMAAYRRCGMSEDEIMLAFRSYPLCFQLSEKKIMSNMDYLVNMGWEPSTIARDPRVLTYNLERRLIPRCSVAKLLFLKGLVKKDFRLGSFLNVPDKTFMDRFIMKYKEEVPQLLDAYHGKSGLS